MQKQNRFSKVCRRRTVLSAVGIAAMGQMALGANVSWIATGGGDFRAPANWNPAVPTSADVAIFANNDTGTVTFSAAGAVNDLSLRNTSGALTFDTSGGTLSFNRFLLGTVAGFPNDITFTGGTFQHTSVGQVFSIGNANGASGNKLTITGAGVRVISTSTGTGSNIGIAGSNNNELHVTNNAFVDIRNNINVGIIGANPASGQVINLNSATFQINNGNRGIFLRQGTLNITNAYADLGGFLDMDDPGNIAVVNFNSGTVFSRATRVANGQPFRIGDGGATPAYYGMSYSGTTLVAADGIVINSNGTLSGTGIITGDVSGMAGAKVAPMILGQPILTSDDRSFGAMTVNGNWNNTGIGITLTAGDFPTQLLNDITPPFDPPTDFITISGAFTHGGGVTIDLASYVAPQDQTYDLRLLGFGSEVGTSASTPVSFANGSPLSFVWRPDGLYVQFEQAVGASMWNIDGGGAWTNAANWLGSVPNAVDAQANLGTILTGAATISLDAPITLGNLSFNNANSYTVQGPSGLSMDVSSGNAQISVVAGAHAVTAAVSLADSTAVDVASGAALSMVGGVSGATAQLSKTGAGQLNVGSVSVAAIDVAGGTVRLQNNGTSSGLVSTKSVTLAAATSVDVTNNAVTVDYVSTSPLADVRVLIQSAYAGGAWTGDGVKTTLGASVGVGYAEASSLSAVPALFGTTDGSTLLVRGTLYGDANLSGTVSLDDFTALAANFGLSGNWVDGDFNYDGSINLNDFTPLAANFGLSVPAEGARGAVPEPATIAGCAMFAGVCAGRRRRAR